jgi:hypothetical protein
MKKLASYLTRRKFNFIDCVGLCSISVILQHNDILKSFFMTIITMILIGVLNHFCDKIKGEGK